jgi:Na+/proline symporter
MGGLLILYTVSGGAKAVAHTQKFQMVVVFAGMFLAGYTLVSMLPEGLGFAGALELGDKLGKMNVITTGITEKGFNWGDRYNVISGIIGGFFIQLSYFGTDQSQVGRYLTGSSIKETRMGLLLNGLVKVPMQFMILLLGVLVFSFYMFTNHPVSFNEKQVAALQNTEFKTTADQLQAKMDAVQASKQAVVKQWVNDRDNPQLISDIKSHLQQEKIIQDSVKTLVKKTDPFTEANDTNYIFLKFVIDYLPTGLIGLLIAVIFLAGWGSIAAALNSLSSTTVVDIHKKFIEKDCTDSRDYRLSKYYTLGWGLFCVVTAMFATKMGSLIEAVNILGSLFYGTILGTFLVAFYMKKVRGNAVFIAAIISEVLVIVLFFLKRYKYITLEYMWLALIGSVCVMVLSYLFQMFNKNAGPASPASA